MIDDPLIGGRAFVAQRIAATRALILAYEAAIAAILSGAQSYQLDTGQTRQLVTKASLGDIRIALRDAESRLATLEQQLGAGRVYVRPGW